MCFGADSSAIYCGLERINNWTCGEDCDAVKATTLASGGDDGLTPLCALTKDPLTAGYVADNGQNVVVGVAGTNTDNLLSYAVDIDFIPTALEDSYFPGVKAKVHRGFYKAFKRMAQPILAAAQNATASGKEVVVTGHSLGAGVGMILSVYLQLHLSVPVNARLFAAPRVGNADWANAVDKIVGVRQQHIVNFNDIVPHLPFLHWGFRHPAGEVYIAQVGGSEYRFCEGQENEHCAGQWNDLKGEMGSYFDYLTTPTHSGPFAGVMVTDDKCAS